MMLALEVEYLNRVIATQFNDRDVAEWPPHPARLYSALVATYASGDRDERERIALKWLAQEAPRIHASHASRRAVYTHYVPVNDPTVLNQTPIKNALQKVITLEEMISEAEDDKTRAKLIKKLVTKKKALETTAQKMNMAVDKSKEPSLDILPEHRNKQARTFPSVTPEDPRVYWVWPEEAPAEVASALNDLARRLVRVGHSSSMVRARVVEALPQNVASGWVPDPQGQHFLRVPLADQLERLESRYVQHQATEPRVLPYRWQTYRRETDDVRPNEDVFAQEVFATEDWIIFERADGPPRAKDNIRYLPQGRGADFARHVRDALMHYADVQDIVLPESITGHTPDGARSEGAHMAIIPLAYVGGKYADGKIRGIALVLPKHAKRDDRVKLLKTIGRWERAARQDSKLAILNEDLDTPVVPVHLGHAGVFHMTRVLDRANMQTLQPSRWTKAAYAWRSVTPVALDRNPGELRAGRGRARSDDDSRRQSHAIAAAMRRAEDTIKKACKRMKLPEPTEVTLSFAPGVTGGESASRFPAFPSQQRPGKPRRVLIHVALRFDKKVEGPLLLGAGRYYGLGLFLPVDEKQTGGRRDT